MRILLTLVLSGTLAIVGCNGDDGGGAAGSGGDGGNGSAGMGGDGGSGGVGGGTGGSGGGTGGDAGSGGSNGVSAEAMAFCDQYETTCTFVGNDRYEDEAACHDAYDNSGQSACYETHLGFAISMSDPDTHCPHATGIGACN